MGERIIDSICGYCSTGCCLRTHVKDGKVVKVVGNPDYWVNRGNACIKGLRFLDHLGAYDRAVQPYLRNHAGKLEPVEWSTALRAFTSNFKNIQQKYGNGSIAFLSTGQMTNEEYAFLGALAKFGMHIIHGDGNTRQCMSTAVVAYQQSFGFDAPPFTYKDFEESDVMIFIGANVATAHPIMWTRALANKNEPVVLVIDPRKTSTARGHRSEHYAVKPKSDLILLYGVANILIENNWIDSKYIREHTIGFEDFRCHVGKYSLEKISAETGLTREQILRFAEIIHKGKRVSFWWTVGINQGYQAVRTAQAIINLALMTGNIGRPGTGANSITGQCNAMGARLFSNTTNLLGGYDFKNPDNRRKVADILGIDENLIPNAASLPYDKLLEEIQNERIKGLWIVCTNPIHSWVNTKGLIETFKKLEYLVVQDMFYTTETAQTADLILPAAGCGEKDGTFINSERRIGIVRKIMDPPGKALPNFIIFKKIAEAWGSADLFKEWSSPEDVFQILKKISKGQPYDISGIKDYKMIEDNFGIQWPFPESVNSFENERRLFEDGRYYFADGKARFFFEDISDPPEKPSDEFPFILLTGRGSVAQWHTLTRSNKSEMLRRYSPPEAYVEINQADAKRFSIDQNEWVVVSSKRGEIKAKAKLGDNVQPGQVFIPMHYREANILTFPAFDPYSRQPSFKYSAVNVKKILG